MPQPFQANDPAPLIDLQRPDSCLREGGLGIEQARC
jgi:hypothetical protein